MYLTFKLKVFALFVLGTSFVIIGLTIQDWYRQFYRDCNINDIDTFMKYTRNITMKPHERDQLYQTARLFMKILEDNDIPYFINGGSLLGIARYGHLIPYDDDIDIWMDASVKSKVAKAMRTSQLAADNLLLYDGTRYHPKVYINKTNCKKPRYYNYCWPFVDLFFYQKNSTHISFDELRLDYLLRDIFPLQRTLLLDIPVFTPRHWWNVIPARSMHECCTAKWNHKDEVKIKNSVCVPCHCLRYNSLLCDIFCFRGFAVPFICECSNL